MLKPWQLNPKYYIYDKRIDRYRPIKRQWLMARRAYWLKLYLSKKGCHDCGNNNSQVLTFDHDNFKEKEFNVLDTSYILKLVTPGIIKRIITEARKCTVRCFNCHKIKTDSENYCPAINETKRQSDYEKYIQEKIKSKTGLSQ